MTSPVNNNYLKELETLFDKFLSDGFLSDMKTSNFQIKNFFGGGAAYVKGNIFMTLTKVGLALKLSEEDLTDIIEIGGMELRYFPNGHIKRKYSIIPENIILNSTNFHTWIRKSIDFVATET